MECKNLNGNLNINRDAVASITLNGGYDCGYTTWVRGTNLTGAITTSKGTMDSLIYLFPTIQFKKKEKKMKIRMIGMILTFLLMTGNLYAANGDLVVNGGLSVTGNSSNGVNANGSSNGVYGHSNQTGVRGESFGGSVGYGVVGKSNADGWMGASIGVSGDGQSYDFYALGAGVNYGASSSKRWKKNVKEVDNALDIVLGIRGVYFDWDKEHGGKHDIGFIGEEVGKYIPEIVVWDGQDRQYVTGMDYSKMTPVLLQAIKEQQKQIEALKTEVQDLKKSLSRK